MAKSQSMEALQDLLIQSSTIQRKLLNLALTENPQEIQELEQIISNAEVSNDKSLAILENAFLRENNSNKQMMAGLQSASIYYRKTSRTFSEMIVGGDKETALEYRTTDLRPAYESYQESQQKMLLLISNDLIRQSNKVSSYASASGWVLFFLGLLPFIYATTKLIYLAIFLKFKTTKIHK
jgi:hypothetical protein